MDFNFPFPSLINLAMIHIGKVKLQELLTNGHFHLDHFRTSRDIRESQVDEIVTSLPLPKSIKHDLADVMTGMLNQLGHILPYVDLKSNDSIEDVIKVDDMELLCDQNGRLEANFWRRYFERHVANYSTVDGLLHLLYRTIELQLLSGIDAIFSRLMPLLGLESDSLEKGTLHMDDYGEYIMVYRPRNISMNVFNDLKNFLCCRIRICPEINRCTKDSIEISTCVSHLDYADLKDYFASAQHPMNPEELQHLLCSHNQLYVIDNFKIMDLEMQRFFAINEEYKFIFLLDIFLIWPFTQLFMRFLEFARPIFTTRHDVWTFREIVRQIPERGHYGFIHANLLEKYWDAIHPDIKRDIKARVAAGANEDGNGARDEDIVSFREALERLSQKNTHLHAKISNDL